MEGYWTTAAKNEALDGVTVNRLSLHGDDPGTLGDNEISGDGYARQSATFGAASGGQRALSAPVEFSGPGLQEVAWIGVWEAGEPDLPKQFIPVQGNTDFSASGEFVVVSLILEGINKVPCPE